MAKKITVIVFVLFLLFNTSAYAGDIPESIMMGEQKALFIGRITDINEDTYSIQPSTIMMGSIEDSEIQIQKFEGYYGTENKPKVGDYIVAVLLDKGKVNDQWIFKATSDNYKTLKLVSHRYNMVVRYEEYINKGKYFEAQAKLDEKNNITTIHRTTQKTIDTEEVEDKGDRAISPKNILIIISILYFFGFVIWRMFKGRRLSNS